MTISEKIRKLRKYAGLTQRTLGELSGTSETTIKQYELGKRQPRIEQLKKIAKVFDFPLYLLLDDNYELGNVELEMKRARPYKSYEMAKPPGPFTVPLSQYNNKDNSLYIDPNLQKIYEIVKQKAHNREKLTDEEEQILIGIPGKLRNKSDDPLSYDNSYSFASSKEEYEARLEQRQKQGEELLLENYRKLNDIGQSEARKRVKELTEIPRYTKPDTPPQE